MQHKYFKICLLMLVVEKDRNTEQTSYLQSKLLQHVDILYV